MSKPRTYDFPADEAATYPLHEPLRAEDGSRYVWCTYRRGLIAMGKARTRCPACGAELYIERKEGK